MELALAMKMLVNGVLFAAVGIVLLFISFKLFDFLTPGKLFDEIVREKNMSLAIVTGAFVLAMATIIAAAIHE